MTTEVACKRFILGFGGMNNREATPDPSTERFLRLDTMKLQFGWQALQLKNPVN